jgi:hypothetical protein
VTDVLGIESACAGCCGCGCIFLMGVVLAPFIAWFLPYTVPMLLFLVILLLVAKRGGGRA